jgi:hypothetical protein
MTGAAILAAIALCTGTQAAEPASPPSELNTYSAFTHDTDINSVSGLTAEEIEFLTTSIMSDSGLAGLGVAIAQAEEEYQVNALFVLAVATHESGHGRSSAARNRNNLFGIMSAGGGQVQYSDKGNSVMGFARLISGRLYFGADRTTISAINGVYAPRNADWSDKVLRFMNEYAAQVSQFTVDEFYEVFVREEPIVFVDLSAEHLTKGGKDDIIAIAKAKEEQSVRVNIVESRGNDEESRQPDCNRRVGRVRQINSVGDVAQPYKKRNFYYVP